MQDIKEKQWKNENKHQKVYYIITLKKNTVFEVVKIYKVNNFLAHKKINKWMTEKMSVSSHNR